MEQNSCDVQVLSPLDAVKMERARQDRKWGEQNHNALKWMNVLLEEVGEASTILNQMTFPEFATVKGKSCEDMMVELQTELVHVAAVAVAFVEALRRRKGTEAMRVCSCQRCGEMEEEWKRKAMRA